MISCRVAVVFLFLSLFLSSCIDFKGASEPYSYAPETKKSTWKPTHVIRRAPLEVAKEEIPFHTEGAPLSLGEILDVALLNSPSTSKSWALAREAAAQYGQSLKNDFILSDTQALFSRSRSAEFTSTRRSIIYESDWSGQFNFSYLILDFGQTRSSSQSALQSLYNADYSHNREIQTVIQSAMNDYYRYLSQEEQVRAARADVVDAQTTLDAVNERFRTGLADIGDQVQAKTTLLQAQLNVVTQRQKLVAAYSQLAVDMGIPANQTLELQGYPDEIRTFKADHVEKLIEEAIRCRPDLLAAEADVLSKKEAVFAAKKERFPKLKSHFDWGRTYYNFNGTKFNDGEDWELSFSLDFPLFRGFYLANAVKVARARLQAAQAQLKKLQLAAIQEVVNYKSDLELAEEALLYSKEFLQAAEEDFRINLKKYKVGTATILDVINAQTSVSDARSQFVSAEKNWYVSVANLAYGTGLLTLQNESNIPAILSKEEENHAF